MQGPGPHWQYVVCCPYKYKARSSLYAAATVALPLPSTAASDHGGISTGSSSFALIRLRAA